MTRINLCILLSVFLALPALAGVPAYQTSTETTLDGDIVYIAEAPSGAGVFVIMKDGHNEIEVLLAPQSFLEQQGLQLRTNDNVKVVGSRALWNGREIVLARQVTAHGKTVTLRNPAGEPRW